MATFVVEATNRNSAGRSNDRLGRGSELILTISKGFFVQSLALRTSLVLFESSVLTVGDYQDFMGPTGHFVQVEQLRTVQMAVMGRR